MKDIKDHIIVRHRDSEYTIYCDGVVYNSTPREVPEDIPEIIFKIRDTYVASWS